MKFALQYIPQWVDEVRDSTNADHYWTTYAVAMRVLAVALGGPWLEKHVMGKSAPTDYFRNCCESEDEKALHGLRVIQLAEYLLNLRASSGFKRVLGELKSRKPEAVVAELEAAVLLLKSGVPFRFLEPNGTTNYDFEFVYGDTVICADAKCKIEDSSPRERSLIDSFNTARRQLPSDKPGVILVKLPQHWHEESADFGMKFIGDAAAQFYRQNTGRIACIYFFQNRMFAKYGFTSGIFTMAGFENPNHRFKSLAFDWRNQVLDLGKRTDWIALPPLCA